VSSSPGARLRVTSQLSLLQFSKTGNDSSPSAKLRVTAALDTKAEQGYEGRTTAFGPGNYLDDTSGYRREYLRELRWISNLLEALEERAVRHPELRSGQQRKRREKALKQVHRIVAQLEATRSCGAGRDEILAAAEICGISRKEAEKALETLHAQGDVFECRKGHYKTT